MAAVTISPRQKWPKGFAVTSPARRPRDAISHTRITGTANAERKNTAWPGGTLSEAALIRLAMAMNTATEASFRRMPRKGFICPSLPVARKGGKPRPPQAETSVRADPRPGLVGEGGEPSPRLGLGVDDARHHGFGISRIERRHVLHVAYGGADGEVGERRICRDRACDLHRLGLAVV